jgi:hypothetical protein
MQDIPQVLRTVISIVTLKQPHLEDHGNCPPPKKKKRTGYNKKQKGRRDVNEGVVLGE